MEVVTSAVVAEMLERSLDETCEDKVPLIEKAHVVESVIDVIKLSGHLSVEWKQKLDDYQGTHSFLVLSNNLQFLLTVVYVVLYKMILFDICSTILFKMIIFYNALCRVGTTQVARN